MISGGLWSFAMVCGGLSYSHTECKGPFKCYVTQWEMGVYARSVHNDIETFYS